MSTDTSGLNWKPYAINVFVGLVAFVVGGLWGYETGDHAGRQNAVDTFLNAPFDALRPIPGEDPVIAATRRKSTANNLEFQIEVYAKPENRKDAQSYFAPLLDRLED